MRRRLVLVLIAVAAGCGPGDDARARREALVASLVNPSNGYSALRLAQYATGGDGDWDRLPEWNPPDAGLDITANPLDLGEAAFFRYPVQLFGGDPSTQGLVTVAFADGTRFAALTCASCHSRVVDGTIVPGLANETIDLGWGPGRIDVAIPAGEEPVAIPDLRVVALETNLHRDGTVRNDPAALAIRIETLLITAHDDAIRPPREITVALATWLRSLAPSEPPSPSTPEEIRGAALFDANCAGCHVPPAFSGPPVPLDVVGTDPRVGLSADRGTGGYRVPSLRGVAARGRLLHDASVPDLATLFDSSRVGGHRFGLALSEDDRAALLAYLTTL
jgi:mono/diheme cytochrome c family protein